MEDEILTKAKEEMEKILISAKESLQKFHAGRLEVNMLKNISIIVYEKKTSILQVASVKNIDLRTVEIRPFEKKFLSDIEKSIQKSNLGINPQNNGDVIILTAPSLTEERRIEIIKIIKEKCEIEKVKIRTIRQKAKDSITKLKKEKKISEDIIEKKEEDLQILSNCFIKEIDKLLEKKQNDILDIKK
jgi:ribosome recycling factor